MRLHVIAALTALMVALLLSRFGDRNWNEVTFVNSKAMTLTAKNINPTLALTEENKLSSEMVPKLVMMSNDQRASLSNIIRAVMRIMEGKSSTDDEKSVLGTGEFVWPKDPDEPIKTLLHFPGSNFSLKYLSLTFVRVENSTPWKSAMLTIQTDQFPETAYSDSLDSGVFDGFKLEKVVFEDRPRQVVTRARVYQFSKTSERLNIRLDIETLPEMPQRDKDRPNSCYAITLTASLRET